MGRIRNWIDVATDWFAEQAQILRVLKESEAARIAKVEERKKEREKTNEPATKKEEPKKLKRADLMFKKLKNEHNLLKPPGLLDGRQFAMAELENCTVCLFDHFSQITVDRCVGTKFFIGPVKGSIFFRDCKDCEITVACGQFRCRDLYDSTVLLYCTGDPVIESSNGLTIGPYNLCYPKLAEHARKVGFNVSDNRWDLVFDFTKGAALNYSVIEPKEWKLVKKSCPGFEDEPLAAVFDYPKKYGGTLADDINEGKREHSGGIAGEFGIGVSKEEAEAEMKKAE